MQLGGITQLRESWRAAWGLPWLDGFALDAKLGLRMLRRSWGLTLAGGLAMTIVITIAAVVFVFLDEFMGRTAPPLDEGERVVALQSWDAEAHRRRDMSRRDLERWGATLQSVEDLGGFQTIERRLIVESRPAEWVRVAEITASGFRLARVPPLLGRWIAEADEHVAAAPVVVIGYDVWRSRFASDRAVIGQTVRLGEILHTVVGVMPEGFAFPVNHRYWIPLRSDPSGSLKPAPEGVVFARLAPGVSLDGAQAELTTIGLLPPATGPTSADARRPRVVPYTFAFTDDVERGELAWQQRIILLLVTLLLVPPCLNIAILIYARTVTRQEEFAARYALGASRGRIVVQLCVEVLVLSSAAGAMALALTRPILTQIGEIIRRFPELDGSLPFWVDFGFSWRAALFVAGLTVLAALIAGLVPALQATGRVLPTALRSLGSRTGIPLGATWTALIVAQVGLGSGRAAVHDGVGVGAPAARRPWTRICRKGIPYRAARSRFPERAGRGGGPACVRLSRPKPPGRGRSPDRSGARRICSDVRRGIARRGASDVRRDGRGGRRRPTRQALRQSESGRPGLLRGIRRPGPGGPHVRRQGFRRGGNGDRGPDVRATGGRRRQCPRPPGQAGSCPRIGGRPLVRDRRDRSRPSREHVPGTNVCSGAAGARGPASPIHLALHAGPDPAAMSRRLHEIGTSLDPTLRLDDVRRLDEVHGETQMSSNLTSYALAIVTLSVLLLSAAGLYALMSFTVTRRRREIGIRMALGARPGRMLASIFARALWQIAAGVVVGVTAALVLHRRLNIEVEGGWHIPGILPAAAIFIMTIGLLSAAGPARRAVRVDPTEALRDG